MAKFGKNTCQLFLACPFSVYGTSGSPISDYSQQLFLLHYFKLLMYNEIKKKNEHMHTEQYMHGSLVGLRLLKAGLGWQWIDRSLVLVS